MKFETYLNAMEYSLEMVDWIKPGDTKWDRRYKAFRTRILKMDAEKDAEIARLHQELKPINRPFDDPTGRYELTNEEWSDE